MGSRLTAFLVATACLFSPAVPSLAAADSCDRACLKTALDQYLTAVTTHKPAAAPLFAGFRQTENAVVVPIGKRCVEDRYSTRERSSAATWMR